MLLPQIIYYLKRGIFMRKKGIILVATGFLLLFPAFLPAQTAAELETMLALPVVNCAQATRFVAASVGNTDGMALGETEKNVFKQAMERKWFLIDTAPDDPLTLGTLSLLIMQAFDMKGGMMYALLPGPRYAFRSMVNRSLIQDSLDPDMKVNGEQFLNILGKTLSETGEEL